MIHALIQTGGRMKTLTIRGLSAETNRNLQDRAKRNGSSLNKTVVAVLEEVLGSPHTKKKTYHDLDHLAGTWSRRESEQFEEQTKAARKIDKELWK
jgi:hypothetical protein